MTTIMMTTMLMVSMTNAMMTKTIMMVIMMAITIARTKMIEQDYHDDYDAADEHDEYE